MGPSRDAGTEVPEPSAMRVGLVCPYSLTLPGGVQGQVLGLARALPLERRGGKGAGAL